MALTIEQSPYITIYRNELTFIFNDKTSIQSQYDINNNTFFIITTLKRLNDNTTIEFKGCISTGSDPVSVTEGLNQLDLAIHLDNGVYKIESVKISVNAVITFLLASDNVMLNVNYHAPSINENLIRVL